MAVVALVFRKVPQTEVGGEVDDALPERGEEAPFPRGDSVRKAAEQDVGGSKSLHALEAEVGDSPEMGMGAGDRPSRQAFRSRLLDGDAFVPEEEAKELPARISRCAYDAS
jgi:hypothetical protein